MANKKVTVFLSTRGGRKMEHDFRKIGDAGDRNFKRVSKASRQASRSLERMNKRAKLVATGVVAATAAMATAFSVRSIGEYREFNKSLTEVSTLIAGTTEEMSMLEDGAKNLANTFGGTAKAQMDAYYQAISAGVGDVKQASQFLVEANKLAIAGVTDVGVAVDGLSSIINAYGQSVSATTASDTIFVGVKRGKTTVEALSSALGKVTPLAASAGVSIQEVVSAVSALTTAGISTSEAVTGVRAILANVAKPTKEAADIAEKLGLQFNISALQAQGFAKFLDEVAKKTGKSEAVLAKLFTGVESLVPILALMGDAGKVNVSILDEMAESAGVTQGAFEKVSDSLDQRLNIQLAKAGTAFLSVGENALKVLVPAMEAISKNAQRVQSYMLSAAVVISARYVPSIVAATVATARMTASVLTLRTALLRSGVGAAFVFGGEFINAMLSREKAVDNVTQAMGEQIIQSQILAKVLKRPQDLSRDSAEMLLEEARARLQNVQTMIRQRKEVYLGELEQDIAKKKKQIEEFKLGDQTKDGSRLLQSFILERRIENAPENDIFQTKELSENQFNEINFNTLKDLNLLQQELQALIEDKDKLNADTTKEEQSLIDDIQANIHKLQSRLEKKDVDPLEIPIEIGDRDSFLEALFENDEPYKALEEYANATKDAAKNFQDYWVGALGQTENAFRDFVRTGKFNFKSLVASMLEDLAVLELRKAVLSPLAGALGGLFGGGGGLGDSNFLAGIFHAGGVVGNAHKYRMLEASAFQNASRFHSGGQVGLRPNERPVIAELGERILSKKETQAYNAGVYNRDLGQPASQNIPVNLTISVDARGAVEGVGQQVVGAVRSMMPEIVQATTGAVLFAQKRGIT